MIGSATTRASDPQTSVDAENKVNAHSVDKDKPSPAMERGVKVVAMDLTDKNGSFTDEELTDKAPRYLRSVGVNCKDGSSSIRRVRLWLSRQNPTHVIQVEGRRNDCQLWKYVRYPVRTVEETKPEPVEAEPAKTQRSFLME